MSNKISNNNYTFKQIQSKFLQICIPPIVFKRPETTVLQKTVKRKKNQEKGENKIAFRYFIFSDVGFEISYPESFLDDLSCFLPQDTQNVIVWKMPWNT